MGTGISPRTVGLFGSLRSRSTRQTGEAEARHQLDAAASDRQLTAQHELGVDPPGPMV